VARDCFGVADRDCTHLHYCCSYFSQCCAPKVVTGLTRCLQGGFRFGVIPSIVVLWFAVVPSCPRALVQPCLRPVVPSCPREVVQSCPRPLVPSCLRAFVPSISFPVCLVCSVDNRWKNVASERGFSEWPELLNWFTFISFCNSGVPIIKYQSIKNPKYIHALRLLSNLSKSYPW